MRFLLAVFLVACGSDAPERESFVACGTGWSQGLAGCDKRCVNKPSAMQPATCKVTAPAVENGKNIDAEIQCGDNMTVFDSVYDGNGGCCVVTTEDDPLVLSVYYRECE